MGNNPETMLKGRTALQRKRGIHAHVDNRGPLTAQALQHLLKAGTDAGARTNTAKHKRRQTTDRSTNASASQNTTGHEGMLTWENALARVRNNFTDPQGNTNALCC